MSAFRNHIASIGRLLSGRVRKTRATVRPRRGAHSVEPLEQRKLLAVLLNELEVNPVGPHSPYEYIEVKAGPADSLNNVYVLSVEGDADPEAEVGGVSNPGFAELVVNLTGQSMGSSGLLVITASPTGHTIPAGTTVVPSTMLSDQGTALENGTNSFLLVRSPTTPLAQWTDYDTNDDGVLELPADAVLLDAVGWTDGGALDRVYGGVRLTQSTDTPDAATRFPGNDTPDSFDAWYNGNLAGASSNSLTYNTAQTSLNFPPGGILTPGAANVPTGAPAPARLNEVDVNPPTATDAPWEYAEVKGVPGQTLIRTFFVSVDGDDASAGVAKMVVNLSGKVLDSNGLLVIKPPTGGHVLPAGAAVETRTGFTLENGSNSFLLIRSLNAIVENSDLDTNDDGVLDLPANAFVVDGVGWSDGGATDKVYGGVVLTQSGPAPSVPDAATRFANDDAYLSAAAWYNGDLTGATADSLTYSATNRSANFPSGGALTPGAPNVPPANQAPQNAAPAFASTNEDQALVFSSAGANAISVSDPDAGSNPIRVSLTATHGTLTLAGTAGLTVVGGANGTGSVSVEGTIAALNAALDGLTFSPARNFSGSESLTVNTNDLGNSGLGGAQSDTDVVNLTIIPVADAPTVSAADAAGKPGAAISLSISAALVDTDESETLSVRVGDVPAGATLSAGTDLGGGTWLLTPGQLAGLTITAPTGGVYTLQATAIATEAADSDSAETADDFSLTVVAPPQNSAPASAATDEDQPLVFAGASGISVSDAGAGSNPIQVALAATQGTLTLATTAGLTFTAGANGTASVTVAGTVAHLNAALDGLTFLPSLHFSGSASLSVTSDDLDYSGLVGAQTDSDTVSLAINPVADAPTVATTAATGGVGEVIALDILAALVDADGSEVLSLRIAGVPADATLSAGTDAGGGAWDLTPAQLAGLTITVPTGGTFVLDVTATATESANADSADSTAQLNLAVIASTNDLVVSSFTGTAQGLRGTTFQFSGQFTDTDVSPHTAVIDWGDGTSSAAAVVESGGAGSISASHVYGEIGAFAVTVTVTGATGTASASAGVNVVDHVVVADPFAPGNWVLLVYGTPLQDHIVVQMGAAATPGAYVLTFTDPSEAVLQQYNENAGVPISRVEAYGFAGNDSIEVGGRAVSAWLFGGAGDDGLNSGMGNDAVFGGDGRDNVKGGNGGNDWLVGGLGRDKLDGKRGEAILVGGSTAHDDDLSAISSIMQRWGGPGLFAARVSAVRDSAFPFYLGAATVFDDAAVDSLKGGNNLDWFIGGAGDTLSDFAAGEVNGV